MRRLTRRSDGPLSALKLKPFRVWALVPATMSSTFTHDRYRRRISDLIAEAVAETDGARRHALLWMADEWVALLARRAGEQDVEGA